MGGRNPEQSKPLATLSRLTFTLDLLRSLRLSFPIHFRGASSRKSLRSLSLAASPGSVGDGWRRGRRSGCKKLGMPGVSFILFEESTNLYLSP